MKLKDQKDQMKSFYGAARVIFVLSLIIVIAGLWLKHAHKRLHYVCVDDNKIGRVGKPNILEGLFLSVHIWVSMG